MWTRLLKFGRTHPLRSALTGAVLAVALAVLFADALLAGPIRTWAERTINANVADGLFSVYTEITVKGGRVDGYIKPLVRNLRVSDKQKDQGKSFGKRVEMHVLQGLANLFKNRSTKQVATVTRISGSTSDPKLSAWQAIRRLLSNGLFRAILPGFLEKGKDLKPGPIGPRESRGSPLSFPSWPDGGRSSRRPGT